MEHATSIQLALKEFSVIKPFFFQVIHFTPSLTVWELYLFEFLLSFF